MNDRIDELSDPNLAKINAMSAADQYSWYLRIKASLPILKETRDVTRLEQAISDYEQRHRIV